MNARNSSSRGLGLGLFCLALFPLSGCGAGTGDVAGAVRYQDKMVTSGSVVIVASDSLPYSGTIQDDGSYVVTKVPTGLATIAVHSPDPNTGNAELFSQVMTEKGIKRPSRPTVVRGDPNKWFPLPDKYRRPDSSGLSMTVTGGSNKKDIVLD